MSNSPATSDSHWRRVCQLALFETDKNLLAGKIAAAREAIAIREEGSIEVSFDERRALKRTVRMLAKLEEQERG